MENRPEWMKDSLVKNIDQKKLDFLNELVRGGEGKSQKEVMPYMMLKMKQAKSENITFTPSELSTMIAAIKKHSTKEELEKIDKIMKEAAK